MNIEDPFSNDKDFILYSQQDRRPLAFRNVEPPSPPIFSKDALTGKSGVEEVGVSDQQNKNQQKSPFPKENPLELETIGQMLNTILDELTKRKEIAEKLNQNTLASDYEQAIQYAQQAQDSLNTSNYKKAGEYLLLLANHLKLVVLGPIGQSIGQYRDSQINRRKLFEFWSMKNQIEFIMRVGFAFSSGNVSLQQFEKELQAFQRSRKGDLNNIFINLTNVEGDLWDYYVENENSVFRTEAPDEYMYLKFIDEQIYKKVKRALDLIKELKEQGKSDEEITKMLGEKGIDYQITSLILSDFNKFIGPGGKVDYQSLINSIKKKIRNKILRGILKSYAKAVLVRYYYLYKINKQDANEYLKIFTSVNDKRELFRRILKNAFLSIPSSLGMQGERGDLLKRIVNVQSGRIAVRSFSTGLAITFPYDTDILNDHRSNILTTGIYVLPASSGFLYLNLGGIIVILPQPVGRPRIPGPGSISLPSQSAQILGSFDYGLLLFTNVPSYAAVDLMVGKKRTPSESSTIEESEKSFLVIGNMADYDNTAKYKGGFYYEEYENKKTDYELNEKGKRKESKDRLSEAIEGWKRAYGALNIRNMGMVRDFSILAYISKNFTSNKYFKVLDTENTTTSDGQGFFNAYMTIRLGMELHRIFMSYEEGEDLLREMFKLNPAFSGIIGLSYEELTRKDENNVLLNTEYGLRYFYYLGKIFSIYFGIGDQGSIFAIQLDKLAFAISAALDDTKGISTLEKFEQALKEHKEITLAFVEKTEALKGIRKGGGPGGIVIYLTPKKSGDGYDFGFDILEWLGFLQGKNVGITSIGIKFYEEEKTTTEEDGTERQGIERITRIRFSAYAGNEQVGVSFSLSDLFIGKSEDGTNIWGAMEAAFYTKWLELFIQYIEKREGGEIINFALQNNKLIIIVRGEDGNLKTTSVYFKENMLPFIKNVEFYPAVQYYYPQRFYNLSFYLRYSTNIRLRVSYSNKKQFLLSVNYEGGERSFGWGGLYIPNPSINDQEQDSQEEQEGEKTGEGKQGTEQKPDIIVPTRTIPIPYPGPSGQTSVSVETPTLFYLYYQNRRLTAIAYYGGDPRKKLGPKQEVVGIGIKSPRVNFGFQIAKKGDFDTTSVYLGLGFYSGDFYVQATWQGSPSTIPGEPARNFGVRFGVKFYPYNLNLEGLRKILRHLGFD